MDKDPDYDDGQFDSTFGKHKTIETIETKMGSDGVEETHITHEIKKANRWTWSGWGPNYSKIDWSE